MPAKGNIVCGVGYNDADYTVTKRSAINGVSKRSWCCPFYSAWKRMLERCYDRKAHAYRPTYVGCSVTQDWLTFSVFRTWMISQDHEGKQLDKDLLVPGNKVYGPDACVFVSSQINKFLSGTSVARGEWPVGVCAFAGRFRAKCCNPFTLTIESLGLFDSPSSAHEAWRERKHQHACRLADLQEDQRVAAALRSRFAHPFHAASSMHPR
jgi:hypothetical protein